MKILKDTLKACIETDSDPGVYPSGAGSGPLPSTRFVESVDGNIEIELEHDDVDDFMDVDMNAQRLLEAWLEHEGSSIEHDIGHGVTVKQWGVQRCNEQGTKIVATLVVEDFEGGTVEDDYDDYEP